MKDFGAPLVCVDLGTTTTRVWLVAGDAIAARTQAPVGVRDTARDGSPSRLRTTLQDLVAAVRLQAPQLQACCVAGAGMITSPLGLAEVPHVDAPAGSSDLAASVRLLRDPDITDLPIVLIPGVRSGPACCPPDQIGGTDVMRGEETLAVGLLENKLLGPGATLLNLGSHWKALRVDEAGRVAGSLTSLSGELIHAAQTQTILSSSIPRERVEIIEPEWLRTGMREARSSGLPRALFCVRLLEQRVACSPQQRLSFLIGAFLAVDLDGWNSRGWLSEGQALVICGAGGVADAWRLALLELNVKAVVLTEAQVESGMIRGIQAVLGQTNAL